MITYDILNMLVMLLVLHVFKRRNLLRIPSNDSTCDTHVPNQLLIICNHMMHICKKPHFFVHPTMIYKLHDDLIIAQLDPTFAHTTYIYSILP